MRVLLVEDDRTASRGISLILKANGAVVDIADTGSEALELVRSYDYDILLIDLMLPDMNGDSLVRQLRAAHITTPVLILSGLSQPQTKVKALAAGADDFVTKPFDKEELVARMHAIVRRSRGFSHASLRVGHLHLNLETREVFSNEVQVPVTPKEYMILELMMLRKGTVLTKERFFDHLYGGLDEPDIKIIDVFICKIRKKLLAVGQENLIMTVWGRGYTLRDPVTKTTSEPISTNPKLDTLLSFQAA
jgi:two-component system cell cycle response regulator CtrA